MPRSKCRLTAALIASTVLVGATALTNRAAVANDPVDPADASAIGQCLADSRANRIPPEQCVGLISDPCQEIGDGASTAGMMACVGREHRVWDQRLNDAYRDLLAALDPAAQAKVRDIQRAWIAWRDTKCTLAYVIFEGGTMAGPVSAACVMDATARRSFELEAATLP